MSLPGAVAQSEPTPTTVVEVLAAAVARWGDRPYIDFSGTIYTYADIDRESTRLARGLASLGVGVGQTVASILDNNVDAVLAWFAINKLGAVSVPVNTAYKGEFLRHQLADAGASVVLTEEDYAGRVLEIASGAPAIKTILHRGAVSQRSSAVQVMPLESAKLDGPALDLPLVKPRDLAMLIYTSGTTGPSKGCMVGHNYVCNLARQYIWCANLKPEDVVWTPLPLFHMNATAITVLAPALLGACAVIYPRFSVSGFWTDIERSKATVANLLGSMAPLLIDAPDTDAMSRCFGQLRLVNCAPFPAGLKARWSRRFGVKDMGPAGYGLTEAAMVVTSRIGEPAPEGSSGRRNEDFDVLIVDDDGAPVDEGVAGEIIIRPRVNSVMFEGYWRRPEATLAIIKDLWLHSGDIGRFDADGHFFFVDRKKDYLRRRGENISSFEMESTFAAHPEIVDVAVHSVLSDLGEDDVKVTAVLKDGATLTEKELCLWSLDHVPYFAVPRYIEFRTDLPRNPMGKIMKYQLRDDGCTAATWDREKAGVEIKKR